MQHVEPPPGQIHPADNRNCFLFFFLWTLGCISPFHLYPRRSPPGPFQWTDWVYRALPSMDMFGPGQLVSALLPAVFHSPAAHFFPAFPTRLGSQPQILIPGPFISFESLRNYLQPEPCKEAFLLATQAVGMGPLTEVTGEFKRQRGEMGRAVRHLRTATLAQFDTQSVFKDGRWRASDRSVNVYKASADSS